MISIIIPTYNNKEYIIPAITSILKQSYSNYEIIVIDDGSTDDTKEWLLPYQSQIKYIYKENGGLASARNCGFEHATGEYIAFLDADDLYRLDKLEKQLEYFTEHPDVGVVYCDVEIIDSEGNPQKILVREMDFDNPKDFLCMLLVRQILPLTTAMMIKRECIDEGLRYNEKYRQAEDYMFTIKLAEQYKFGYISEPLYMYRRHNNNLTNNHVKQLQHEAATLKELGEQKITEIVNATTFETNIKEFILAKIFMKLEEWDRARILLDRLINQLNDSYVFFYYGVCCMRIQDIDTALKAWLRSLELNPHLAEVHNNLACVLIEQGKYDIAKVHIDIALGIKSNYMDALHNADVCRTYTRDYKLTTRELRKVLTVYGANQC